MDYTNVCRICLEQKTDMVSLYNEVVICESIQYVDMLQECTSLQVSKTDTFPKILCNNCANLLQASYEFKRKCISSEQKLLEIFRSAETIKQERKTKNSDEGNSTDLDNTNFGQFVFLNEVHVKVELDQPCSISGSNGNTVESKFKCTVKRKTVPRRLKSKMIALNNLECVECGECFLGKNDYKQHMHSVHAQKQYKCDICEKVYIAYWAFVNHKLTHGYNCRKCFKNFESMSELEEHTLEHNDHSGFVCKECGKEFIRKRRLILHMRTHTGERPHLCTVCGKAFALQGNLNTHMRIHNGRKPYSCDLCNSSFAQWNSLRSHLITHSNEKNYVCPTCGKRLSRQSALKRHIMSHTDVRNYPCQICGKRFKASSECNKHKIIHTGEKNHKCTFCGKSFNRADNLRIHKKIHTGERPHVCSICGRGFIQLHVLNTHRKTHQK